MSYHYRYYLYPKYVSRHHKWTVEWNQGIVETRSESERIFYFLKAYNALEFMDSYEEAALVCACLDYIWKSTTK